MRIPRLFILLVVIFSSCTSADNKTSKETPPAKQNKLSREEARELIDQEIEKTKDDVGGRKKDIKVFSVYSITDNEGIYTVRYIWSGTMQLSSVPPEPGEELKSSYEVKDDTAEIKVRYKDSKWQIIPDH